MRVRRTHWCHGNLRSRAPGDHQMGETLYSQLFCFWPSPLLLSSRSKSLLSPPVARASVVVALYTPTVHGLGIFVAPVRLSALLPFLPPKVDLRAEC